MRSSFHFAMSAFVPLLLPTWTPPRCRLLLHALDWVSQSPRATTHTPDQHRWRLEWECIYVCLSISSLRNPGTFLEHKYVVVAQRLIMRQHTPTFKYFPLSPQYALKTKHSKCILLVIHTLTCLWWMQFSTYSTSIQTHALHLPTYSPSLPLLSILSPIRSHI